MMLLVIVLPVVAKAITIIQTTPEMFLMIFDIANCFSPRCSANVKNISQVKTDRKFWIMVHPEMDIIPLSSFQSKSALMFIPYLCLSFWHKVQIVKKTTDT